MTYKILLVDDELEITDINKRYLQQAGYDVTVASDGAQALEVFRKNQYDLIISDIMMPKMDGYDFISKPFSPRELVLRVKNILNRIYGKSTQSERLVIGDLVMDHSTRVVTVANQDLNLTNKAFDLLWILANHLNHVFSKTELYERVWEEEYLDDTNTLNVHIHSLRNDLAKYSTDQTPTIKTVWGLGYKLEG
ncbi:Response regulator SaeR [Streptococcus canis]|uniref:Response regulator SaeR n=1 Tax=Streptococcus canis TaxID=1329 RepID=A0A3P5Y1V4_STRCB|nr:response regulator transcription factor [Streptococcus canis]VDC42421.1 Response regulator SaeR [Streptococcus canis]